jgi:hypothetical protein
MIPIGTSIAGLKIVADKQVCPVYSDKQSVVNNIITLILSEPRRQKAAQAGINAYSHDQQM